MYLKLEICFVCREFIVFKYVFIVLFKTNQMIICIWHQKFWELAFKTCFLVHNIHLYLCWQVVNTKMDIVLNVQYLRFLIHLWIFVKGWMGIMRYTLWDGMLLVYLLKMKCQCRAFQLNQQFLLGYHKLIYDYLFKDEWI